MRRLLERLVRRMALSVVRLPDPEVGWLAGGPVVVDGQRLDAQVQVLLRLLALQERPRLHRVSAEEAREVYASVQGLVPGVAAEMSRVDDRMIASEHGGIPIRIYTPRDASRPAPLIVYLHGEGWVLGDLDTHDPVCRSLAIASGAIVVAVGYRRPPEHPFPAPLDDALAAWRSIVALAPTIGGSTRWIGVAGDGAGANLAIGVCREAVREAILAPTFEVLFYPSVDLSTERPSWEIYGDDFLLTADDMRWFRTLYLAGRTDSRDPRVSPLLADDFSRLPPTAIALAGFDVLRDEGRLFADRLRSAGVEVRAWNHPSLIHGWASLVSINDAARGAMAEVGEWVRQITGRRIVSRGRK